MKWIDFYNRDVFEHTHASSKPRYRKASCSVLGNGISCEVPPAELVQPRDREGTDPRDNHHDDRSPRWPLPQPVRARTPLVAERCPIETGTILSGGRAVVGLYHPATLAGRKRPPSLRAAFQGTSRKVSLKSRTRGAFRHQVPACHASDKGWPHSVPTLTVGPQSSC